MNNSEPNKINGTSAMDHWEFFNWPNILSEAKQRLRQVRESSSKHPMEMYTLEYWTAWCAHANAAACLVDELWNAAVKVDPSMAEYLRKRITRE